MTSPRAQCEFYFDTSSPWTYLAFARIREIAARTETTLILKPFLVGAVFNVSNKSIYASRDKFLSKTSKTSKSRKISAKEIWMDQDIKAWASFMSLDIKTMSARFNSKTTSGAPGHPISSVKMLRLALVAQKDEGEAAMIRFAMASFNAYWGTLKDVSNNGVLQELHAEANIQMSFEKMLSRSKDEDIKHLLRQNTQQVIDRGGFGSPSIYVTRPDKEPGFQEFFTWGNDRMELVEAAMLKARGKPWRFHSRL